MQCPSCNHQAPQAAFGDPLRCPECGIFYEKAVELKHKKIMQDEARPREQVIIQHVPIKEKKKTSMLTWVITVILVIGMVRFFSSDEFQSSSAPRSSTSSGAPATEAQSAVVALKYVDFDFSWNKKSDILMSADFTLNNKNTFAVKDFKIKCIHTGASGTVLDSNTRTIYEILPPREKRTFKDFDMGFIHSQAVSSSCYIVELTI